MSYVRISAMMMLKKKNEYDWALSSIKIGAGATMRASRKAERIPTSYEQVNIVCGLRLMKVEY